VVEDFLSQGWIRFPCDPEIRDWVEHARAAADAALRDPALRHWYQCEDTWFVGVDALPNDAQGRLGGSGPLTDGQWARFHGLHFSKVPPLHKGQLSVVFPGYPNPRAGEGAAAARYRQTRFSAHVDGILPIGDDRRRMIREPHAFVLGVPLNETHPDAAPMVAWEGSHRIMQEAFNAALKSHDPAVWSDVDMTAAYQAARRVAFETCPMVRLYAKPGETYLLHRHTLHGIAGWGADAPDMREGRRIAYFRPEFRKGGVMDWLTRP
jgi:hypothetical protein